MASPTRKPASDANDPFARYPPRPPQTGPPELVNPGFLLQAGGLTLLAALSLAYLSVCLLVWQGSWQRFLHPSKLVDKTPASVALAYEATPFDAGETGTPRLTGWWVPADSTAAATVLYLHEGDGSLSTSVLDLRRLHLAGLNVFAFDYRGFGQSSGPHPTEARMEQDASAALDYLINTRHIAADRIVPYGVGLGAVLAAKLVAAHPELKAVVLDRMRPNAWRNVVDDPQSRLLPMHLLVGQQFDVTGALARVHQQKLLLANPEDRSSAEGALTQQQLLRAAPDPKTTVTFDRVPTEELYEQTLHRFLDQALPPH